MTDVLARIESYKRREIAAARAAVPPAVIERRAIEAPRAHHWHGTQTVAATGSGTLPAAATYTRLRVEVDSSGNAKAFQDKSFLGQIPGATGAGTHATSTSALDADEEVSPVFYIESNTTSVLSADVRRFAAWAYRTT